MFGATAHDRAAPYEMFETCRSRAKIRFADERFSSIAKYTYMTPEFGIGSIEGGLHEPIQQHSWDVTFATARPNNTVFGLHPNYSDEEMGMFFPEEPERIVSSVTQSKGSYASPDKWLGGSLYERLLQYRGSLVALYDIPTGVNYQHIDVFVPKSMDTVERDTSGWIFCRMENAFTAIYPFNQAYQWTEEKINWRLRMPTTTALDGYAVDCATAQQMSYEAFKAAHRAARPALALRGGQGTQHALATMRAANGDEIAAWGPNALNPRLVVNGVPQPPHSAMLYDGPFLQSQRGSGIIHIRYRGQERVLDFTPLAR